jgi:DNA excision repair protein ERCC-3
MPYNPQNPLIVQSDRTVLLEVDSPLYEGARDALAAFAELEKSPEHIHTYRITPLSLWNAAAAGMEVGDILDALHEYTKYDVPQNIIAEITDYVSRYGRVKLMKGADLNPGRADDNDLVLHAEDPVLMAEITHSESVKNLLGKPIDSQTVSVPYQVRGHIKQALIKIGFPVEDLAGYVSGSHLEIAHRPITLSGSPFDLRDYQREAADVFHLGGDVRGGSGVIVLPCGAGKTIVGLGILFETQCHTLILSTNTIAVRQWIDEFLDKTTIAPEDIGEYTGDRKEIRPITVTTYQILTYRKRKSEDFVHLGLFSEMDWGLIVYDEVHLLPAPVFRMTAEIQGKRRLGLTATLVREDGREDDVFSLIGPKKYDVPWRELEAQGWIATAECTEIRVDLPEHLRMSYAIANARQKFRIASENPDKFPIVCELIDRHEGDQILVIGQYIEQLKGIATSLNAPLIMGQTPNLERGKLYEQFRQGNIKLLVVSKVANFAIDLPDANVAIQISGTFGSRQEEAQRLGRILRPKTDGSLAHFYSIVTRDSRDQEFAINRQLFLTEQGYRYTIRYGHEYDA